MAGTHNTLERVSGSNVNSTGHAVPTLFISTTLIAVLFLIIKYSSNSEMEHLQLSTVTGYFLQDDPGIDDENFDFTKNKFGLIKRPYDSDASFDPDLQKTQWQRFEAEVKYLNREKNSKTSYKVLYMGRHGEGYHNVAEKFYGKEAWQCYWSRQNGNGTINWLDAELTPLGMSQAKSAHKFWVEMIAVEGIPLPEEYYVSPLLRCQQTALNTFSGLSLPAEKPFKPIIKELLRECNGVHTCDKRSSKKKILDRFPGWAIEDGFTELDELWSSTHRETNNALDQRTKVALDDILLNSKSTFISISSHSGQIQSALRVLGHQKFNLNTGQAIPVLVKIDRIPSHLLPVKKAPWFIPKMCSSPPETR